MSTGSFFILIFAGNNYYKSNINLFDYRIMPYIYASGVTG